MCVSSLSPLSTSAVSSLSPLSTSSAVLKFVGKNCVDSFERVSLFQQAVEILLAGMNSQAKPSGSL